MDQLLKYLVGLGIPLNQAHALASQLVPGSSSEAPLPNHMEDDQLPVPPPIGGPMPFRSGAYAGYERVTNAPQQPQPAMGAQYQQLLARALASQLTPASGGRSSLGPRGR